MTPVVNTPPTIRPAKPEDAGRLADLATQLGYPSTPQEITRRLVPISSHAEHAVFVAESEGEVAGWVHVYLHSLLIADTEAEIGGLVVDEARRGTGVGRLLMQQAERWALEQGCGSVYVRSNVIRTEAHKFYEELGYVRFKTQHAFRTQCR